MPCKTPSAKDSSTAVLTSFGSCDIKNKLGKKLLDYTTKKKAWPTVATVPGVSSGRFLSYRPGTWHVWTIPPDGFLHCPVQPRALHIGSLCFCFQPSCGFGLGIQCLGNVAELVALFTSLRRKCSKYTIESWLLCQRFPMGKIINT